MNQDLRPVCDIVFIGNLLQMWRSI